MSGGTSCISWIPGLLAEEGAELGRLPVRPDDGEHSVHAGRMANSMGSQRS